MKKALRRALVVSFSLAWSSAWAQNEGPPNEPPYTTESEFEETSAPATTPQIGTKGVQYIRHPHAKKGLKLIDEKGNYYYAPDRVSQRNQTASVRFGSIRPPNIQAADGASFRTMYGSGDPFVIAFDYEWQPLQAFGKLGVQMGIGYFNSTGKGRFITGQEAREKYTFHAIPLSAGVIYRLEFFERQWVAPYVAGGGSYYGLIETRDDDKAPKLVGTPAAYGAGGLMINVAALDRETAYTLDSEYGLAGLWISLEARQVQASNQDLDIGGLMVSFGISADY